LLRLQHYPDAIHHQLSPHRGQARGTIEGKTTVVYFLAEVGARERCDYYPADLSRLHFEASRLHSADMGKKLKFTRCCSAKLKFY